MRLYGRFKSFGSAAITLAGIELAHRIRKRQFSLGRAQSDCKYWGNNKFDVARGGIEPPTRGFLVRVRKRIKPLIRQKL